MFESFAKVKNEVLEVTELIKMNKDIDIDVLNNSELDKKVNNLNNGEFKIALIAPFSAGKSTFINSLIGQDILSMEITAETSVITKVKYSDEIKLEITYRNDDRVEVIPAESEAAITSDELKGILQEKTTVKGENTEDNIKEVKVYYPIEMCKDKVELVDTPGLFARHEKHAAITTNILPAVNAVIFMIDPESVGEQNFTEVIRNYVRNAKTSNMETGGKHIFFVINKIDRSGAQPEKVVDQVIELFIELDATDEQLDFPIVYASAKNGIAKMDLEEETTDLSCLFETIINIKNSNSDIIVSYDEENLDELNYIAGKSLSYVNKKAMEGTIKAHVDGGVPNILINMDNLNEETIGHLIYFFEKACAVSGMLLGVNPFDQPGVEKYKENMFELLGKYE